MLNISHVESLKLVCNFLCFFYYIKTKKIDVTAVQRAHE